MAGLALPSLPTDNLYKFAALAGVAIWLMTIYLLVSQTLNLVGRVMDAREAVDTERARYPFILQRTQDLKQLLENSIAARNGTLKKDPHKLEIAYSDDEIKAAEKDLRQSNEDSLLEEVKVKYAIARIDYELIAALFMVVVGGVVAIFGIRLSFWGFRCWLERIQLPLDDQLRKGLAAAESGDASGDTSPEPEQDEADG